MGGYKLSGPILGLVRMGVMEFEGRLFRALVESDSAGDERIALEVWSRKSKSFEGGDNIPFSWTMRAGKADASELAEAGLTSELLAANGFSPDGSPLVNAEGTPINSKSGPL